jgi:hypothetical protein
LAVGSQCNAWHERKAKAGAGYGENAVPHGISLRVPVDVVWVDRWGICENRAMLMMFYFLLKMCRFCLWRPARTGLIAWTNM